MRCKKERIAYGDVSVVACNMAYNVSVDGQKITVFARIFTIVGRVLTLFSGKVSTRPYYG